ncbi:MAG: ribbon-helix-helix domain-containing protein [Alphaproteobacteria bacterium]
MPDIAFEPAVNQQRYEEPQGLISKNIKVNGQRTSVRLEKAMWEGLEEISQREGASINEIGSLIMGQKNEGMNFTSAIRVFIMSYYRAAATEEGHRHARHGDFTQRLPRLLNG